MEAHSVSGRGSVMDRVRALTDGQAFDRAYESGPGEDLVELVRQMAALPVPDE